MRIRDALRSSRVRLGVLLVGLLFVAGGAGTTDTELKLGPYTAKLGADGKLDPNWRGVPRGAPPHVPDLCLSADEVLVALVGTSEATWETWPVVNGNAIVTTATVTSLATIRSEVGHDRALTLRMYGGTLPSGLSMTAGGPVLRTGETYLLFLGTNTRYESPEILGWRLLPEGVAALVAP